MSKHAFLCGINSYPGAPLQGCLGDVTKVSNILTGVYGWKTSEIETLLESEATGAALLNAIGKASDLAQAGNEVIFLFSGHGARTASAQGICPYDFAGFEEQLVQEADIRVALSKLTNTAKMTVIFDTCHSTGLIKSFSPGVTKAYPGSRQAPLRKLPPINQHCLFLSACRADQTAADAMISGEHNGAFTWALTKEIEATPHAAVVDIMTRAKRRLADMGFTQIPGIGGSSINAICSFEYSK